MEERKKIANIGIAIWTGEATLGLKLQEPPAIATNKIPKWLGFDGRHHPGRTSNDLLVVLVLVGETSVNRAAEFDNKVVFNQSCAFLVGRGAKQSHCGCHVSCRCQMRSAGKF